MGRGGAGVSNTFFSGVPLYRGLFAYVLVAFKDLWCSKGANHDHRSSLYEKTKT